MELPVLRLKPNQDRRLRAGHLWIYSNEVDTAGTPLKSFQAGEAVVVGGLQQMSEGAQVEPTLVERIRPGD